MLCGRRGLPQFRGASRTYIAEMWTSVLPVKFSFIRSCILGFLNASKSNKSCPLCKMSTHRRELVDEIGLGQLLTLLHDICGNEKTKDQNTPKKLIVEVDEASKEVTNRIPLPEKRTDSLI